MDAMIIWSSMPNKKEKYLTWARRECERFLRIKKMYAKKHFDRTSNISD